MYGEKEMDFAVYLIHCLAEAWKKRPKQVYAILDQTGILDGYIFPCYDTLHTLGREYLINDITEFAEEKGVRI